MLFYTTFDGIFIIHVIEFSIKTLENLMILNSKWLKINSISYNWQIEIINFGTAREVK